MFKSFRNTENKQEGKGFHPLKAMGMMGMCCLLPIILLAVLPLLNLSIRNTAFLSSISTLICPIMMMVMMAVMFLGGKKKNCCSESQQENTNKE